MCRTASVSQSVIGRPGCPAGDRHKAFCSAALLNLHHPSRRDQPCRFRNTFEASDHCHQCLADDCWTLVPRHEDVPKRLTETRARYACAQSLSVPRDFHPPSISFDKAEKITDGTVGLDGMSQGLIRHRPVMISSPHLFALNESFRFQVDNDPLHSTLRDTDKRGDFSQDDGRVAGQKNQDMGMVCEERPAPAGRFRPCIGLA